MFDITQIARDAAARVAAVRLTRTQKIVVVSAAVAAAAYVANRVMGGEDEAVSTEMGLTDSGEKDLVTATLGQVFTTLGQIGIAGYAALQGINQPQQSPSVSNSVSAKSPSQCGPSIFFDSCGVAYDMYNTPSGKFVSQDCIRVSVSNTSPSVSNSVSAESPSQCGPSIFFDSSGIAYDMYNTPSGKFVSQDCIRVSTSSPSQPSECGSSVFLDSNGVVKDRYNTPLDKFVSQNYIGVSASNTSPSVSNVALAESPSQCGSPVFFVSRGEAYDNTLSVSNVASAESPSQCGSPILFVFSGVAYDNTPSGKFASQNCNGVSASNTSPSVSNGIAESPSRAPSPSGVSATGVASLQEEQNNLVR